MFKNLAEQVGMRRTKANHGKQLYSNVQNVESLPVASLNNSLVDLDDDQEQSASAVLHLSDQRRAADKTTRSHTTAVNPQASGDAGNFPDLAAATAHALRHAVPSDSESSICGDDDWNASGVTYMLSPDNKEDFYRKYERVLNRYRQYKQKYHVVLDAYRQLQEVNQSLVKEQDVLKTTLQQTQDNLLGRIEQLREQVELSDDKRQHLQLSNEEKDDIIVALRTQNNLLKSSPSASAAFKVAEFPNGESTALIETQQEQKQELLALMIKDWLWLRDYACSYESHHVKELKDKIDRLNYLLTVCKEQLQQGVEKVSGLGIERESLIALSNEKDAIIKVYDKRLKKLEALLVTCGASCSKHSQFVTGSNQLQSKSEDATETVAFMSSAICLRCELERLRGIEVRYLYAMAENDQLRHAAGLEPACSDPLIRSAGVQYLSPSAATTDVSMATALVFSLSDRISLLESALTAKSMAVEHGEELLQQQREATMKREADLAAVEDQLQKVIAENADLNNRWREEHDNLAMITAELSAVRLEKALVSDQRQDLVGERDELTQKFTELHQKAKTRFRELKDLNKTFEQRNTELEASCNRLRDENEKLKLQLESEISDQQQYYATVRQHLTEKEKEVMGQLKDLKVEYEGILSEEREKSESRLKNEQMKWEARLLEERTALEAQLKEAHIKHSTEMGELLAKQEHNADHSKAVHDLNAKLESWQQQMELHAQTVEELKAQHRSEIETMLESAKRERDAAVAEEVDRGAAELRTVRGELEQRLAQRESELISLADGIRDQLNNSHELNLELQAKLAVSHEDMRTLQTNAFDLRSEVENCKQRHRENLTKIFAGWSDVVKRWKVDALLIPKDIRSILGASSDDQKKLVQEIEINVARLQKLYQTAVADLTAKHITEVSALQVNFEDVQKKLEQLNADTTSRHQNELLNLRAELQQLQKTHAKEVSDVKKKHQQKVSAMKAELTTMSDYNERLVADIKVITEENKTLSSELLASKQELASLRETIKKLRSEINETNAENEGNVRELLMQISLLKRDNEQEKELRANREAELVAENAELERQVIDFKALIGEHQSTIEHYRDEMDRLKGSVVEFMQSDNAAERRRLEETCKSLEENNGSLNCQMAELSSMLSDQNAKILEQKNIIESAEASLRSLKTEKTALERQNIDLSANLEASKNQEVALAEKLDQLKQVTDEKYRNSEAELKSSFATQLHSLTYMKNSLEIDLAKERQTIGELSEELMLLKAENASVKEQNKLLLIQHTDSQTAACAVQSRLESRVQSLEHEILTIKDLQRDFESERDMLSDRNSKLGNENGKLRTENESLTSNLDTLSRDLKLAHESIGQLRNQLHDANRTSEMSQMSIDLMTKDVELLEKKLQQTVEENCRLEKSLKILSDINSTANFSLQEQKEKYHTVDVELQELKRSHSELQQRLQEFTRLLWDAYSFNQSMVETVKALKEDVIRFSKQICQTQSTLGSTNAQTTTSNESTDNNCQPMPGRHDLIDEKENDSKFCGNFSESDVKDVRLQQELSQTELKTMCRDVRQCVKRELNNFITMKEEQKCRDVELLENTVVKLTKTNEAVQSVSEDLRAELAVCKEHLRTLENQLESLKVISGYLEVQTDDVDTAQHRELTRNQAEVKFSSVGNLIKHLHSKLQRHESEKESLETQLEETFKTKLRDMQRKFVAKLKSVQAEHDTAVETLIKQLEMAEACRLENEAKIASQIAALDELNSELSKLQRSGADGSRLACGRHVDDLSVATQLTASNDELLAETEGLRQDPDDTTRLNSSSSASMALNEQLEAKIVQLANDLAESNAEKLTIERKALSERSELETIVRNLKEELTASNKRQSETADTQAELISKLETVTNKLKESDACIQLLTRLLNELASTENVENENLDLVSIKNADLERALGAVSATLKSLRLIISAERTRSEQLAAELTSSETKMADLKRRADARLVQVKRQLLSELAERESEVTQQKATVDELRNQLAEYDSRLLEANELKCRADKLAASVTAETGSEIARLNVALAERDARVRELEKERTELVRRLAVAEKEVSRLSSTLKVDADDAELKLEQELGRIKREYEEKLKDVGNDHNSKLKQLLKEIRQEMAEKEREFQVNYEQLQEKSHREEDRMMRVHDLEVRQLRREIQERDNTIDELNENIEVQVKATEMRFQSEVDLCMERIATLESTIETLNHDLQAAKSQQTVCDKGSDERSDEHPAGSLLAADCHDDIPCSDSSVQPSPVEARLREKVVKLSKQLEDSRARHSLQVIKLEAQLDEAAMRAGRSRSSPVMPSRNDPDTHRRLRNFELQISSLQNRLVQLSGDNAELHVKQLELEQEVTSLREKQPKNSESSADRCQSVPLVQTEFEYLKNILYQYMMGTESRTLAKVLCTVAKFSDEQTQAILEHLQANVIV